MLEITDIDFPMVGLLADIDEIGEGWVRKATYDLADIMEDNFRTAIGTGRNRNSRGAKRSAAGEIPVLETGYLASSVDAFITGKFTGQVVVAAEYAAELESDRDRPFVRPGIADLFEKFDLDDDYFDIVPF